MAIGRPTKPLNVTPEEKEKLTMMARRPKTGQALGMRARIVLGCSDGLSNGEVAKRLRITGATVCKWRERFRVDRLEGLLDESEFRQGYDGGVNRGIPICEIFYVPVSEPNRKFLIPAK